MSEDARTAQVRSELEQIAAIVSDLTGLPSNWNGELVLVPDAGFQGKKLYSCGILISEELATSDLRWRTLIHEALHAVSVGYYRSAYDDAIGWEEGIVEKIQRQLRPQVLDRLQISVPESVFTEWEAAHEYNGRIHALEQIRSALGRRADDFAFYMELLAVPIRERSSSVFAQGRRLPEQSFRDFVRVFSAANAVLREPDQKGGRNAPNSFD